MHVWLSTNSDSHYIFEFPSVARFGVDLAERLIFHQLSRLDTTPDTITHLLHDQVLPRLIAHDGSLVLHGGGISIGGIAVAVMAPTGHGKSTLSASLQRSGHRLLGDDALIVDHDATGPVVSAVYPSLRLLPDSISYLFGSDAETRPMAEYSAKQHVAVDATDAKAPLAALVFLSAPEPDISLRRLSVAEACMSLIANSFALDPTDRKWAAANMRRASALAASVPAYALSYPRDYARLPDVHAAILDMLRETGA